MKEQDPIALQMFGQHHLEIGHPDNPKKFRICGAKTRNEMARHPICTHPAGFRTAHIGVGRCYLHGGSSLSGPAHAEWKGGRYAKVWKGRLKEHIESLQQDDSNPLDLMPELEVSRVTLSLALDRLMTAPVQPNRIQQQIGSVSDDGNYDQDYMGAHGPGTNFSTNEDSADIPGAEFLSIPIPEGNTQLLAFDMRLVSPDDINLVRECTNDIVNTVSKMIAARNQTALTKGELMFILATMKEGINRFVPKENREAFVRYLMENVPGGGEDAAED